MKTNDKACLDRLLSVLDREWGTCGPEFLNANKALAAAAGCRGALCVFSASAALECILRAENIGRGDEVVVAAWSDPVDSMTCAAVGAVPVFADVDPDTLTLSPNSVRAAVTPRTSAVIADLPGSNPCAAASLSALCREKGLFFIINAADAWGTELNGKRIIFYADAAFADLGSGRLLDAGMAGAVLTDDADEFEKFFAYHNCGRPQDEGATLDFDSTMGGDLRIAEWQCALIAENAGRIPEYLRERLEAFEKVAKTASPVPVVGGGKSSRCRTLVRGDRAALEAAGLTVSRRFEFMPDAPVWNDPYYLKITGAAAGDPGNFPVSERAAREAWLCQ